MSTELLIIGFPDTSPDGDTLIKWAHQCGVALSLGTPELLYYSPNAIVLVFSTSSNRGLACKVDQHNLSSNFLRGLLYPKVSEALHKRSHQFNWDQVHEHVPQLCGEAAAIHFCVNGKAGDIQIQADGASAVPFYYSSVASKHFVASTSLHVIAGLHDPAEIDVEGCLQYLTFLHPLGARTILKSVSAIGPKQKVVWTYPKTISVQSGSPPLNQYKPAEERGPLDFKSLVSKYRDSWNVTMKDLSSSMGPDSMVSLSGGLDSRAIANGLVTTGTMPACFTNGSLRTKEVSIARDVAETLELKHHVIPIESGDLLQNVETAAKYLDGSHSPFEMYLAWQAEKVRNLTSTVVQGTSGDVFWGSAKYDICGLESKDALTQKIDSIYEQPKAFLEKLMNEDTISYWKKQCGESIAQSIKPYNHLSPADAGVMWNLDNRQRRWGFAVNSTMWRLGFNYLNPFFFKSFLEYAKYIDERYRNNGKLHLRAQQSAFPKISEIPYLKQWLPICFLENGTYQNLSSKKKDFIVGRLSLAANTFPKSPKHALNMLHHSLIFALQSWNAQRRHPCLQNRINSHLSVYRHREWLMTDKVYTARFQELLEEARSNIPSFIRTQSIGELLDVLSKHPEHFPNVEVVGRIVTLAIWMKTWKHLPRLK